MPGHQRETNFTTVTSGGRQVATEGREGTTRGTQGSTPWVQNSESLGSTACMGHLPLALHSNPLFLLMTRRTVYLPNFVQFKRSDTFQGFHAFDILSLCLGS